MFCPIKIERTAHFSPLRYPGGKTSLTSFFNEVIKNHELHDAVYIEPYAGGAGAALALLFLEKIERIIVNDLDPAIFAFWYSAVNFTEKFMHKIDSVDVSIEEWYKQKNLYVQKTKNIFDLGFATFFLNRTNRSGIVEGGPIGGYEQKGEWKIDARFNKKTLIERFEKIYLYSDRISIKNEDGISLLKTQAKKQRKSFIYLDPPYYEKGSSLYLNHYKEKNHRNLAKFLNENNKLNWLLTYDNIEYIRNLYKNRKIEEFSLNYSAYKKTKAQELMIFSDTLSN